MQLRSSGAVETLINECGAQDSILLLNQVFVLFTGMAGRLGFNGMTDSRFLNNWYDFGHSGYFLKDGLPYDEFMAERWVPLLLKSQIPTSSPRRDGGISGLSAFILQNAEPIKLCIYLVPALLLVLTYRDLYKAEQSAHRLSTARQLAYEAQLLAQQDPSTLRIQALLSIESLRHDPSLAGQRVLQSALSLLPKREIHMQADGALRAVDLARGGSMLAMAYADGTVQLKSIRDGGTLIVIHTGTEVKSVAFSPDGNYLATGGTDHFVRVWSVSTGAQPVAIDQGADVNHVRFSNDGLLLLTFSMSFQPSGAMVASTQVWSIHDRRRLIRIDAASSSFVPSLTNDSRYLVTADRNYSIGTWNLQRKKEGGEFGFAMPSGSAGFCQSSTGELLYIKSDESVAIVDLKSGRFLARVSHKREDPLIWHASFSSDCEQFSTAGADGTAVVWSSRKGQQLAKLTHEAGVNEALFSPDGTRLATRTDRIVRLWNWENGKELIRIVRPDRVLGMMFDGEGRNLVTYDQNAVQVWSTQAGPSVMEGVQSVPELGVSAFSPDGKYLVTPGTNYALLWRVEDGVQIGTLQMSSQNSLRSISFNATSDRIVAGSWNGKLWRLGGKLQETRLPCDCALEAVAFGNNGVIVGETDLQGTIIWDVSTGNRLRSLHDEPAPYMVNHAILSSDGRILARLTPYNTFEMWELSEDYSVANQTVAMKDIFSIGLSADGQVFATSNGKQISVFRSGTNKLIKIIPFYASHLILSHDGSFLAIVNADGIEVFDTQRGTEIAAIFNPEGAAINAVSFSADDKSLVGVYDPATNGFRTALARVWRWQIEDQIADACSHISTNLTPQEWLQYVGPEPRQRSCSAYP